MTDQKKLDMLRYGEVSKELREKAEEGSPLISLADTEYLPFNPNGSLKTAKELSFIKNFQNKKYEWHEGENKEKLDKAFPDLFFQYAKDNNLIFDKNHILETVRSFDSFILDLKIFYGRPRPYQINKYHNIDIKVEDSDTAQTPSYPSGHAFQGRLIYKMLAEKYPEHELRLREISERISNARILRGLHFPSDNDFSHMLVDKYIMPRIQKKVYISNTKSKKTMNAKFKYTTRFHNQIEASCVDGLCKKFQISNASLENLKSLIPENVDLSKNIDLLAVAFNAAVVNKFNRNGDGIDTDTALAVSEYFINKPTNIEHNKEKVVGHIVSSSFSSIEDSSIIEPSLLKNTNDPFNISLGALVYKVVNPTFAKLIEQSKDGKEFQNLISASWEIGFNDFYIAIGSDNLSEAEIVTDKKQIKDLQKYLKAYDGDGEMADGTKVNRLVVGNVYPLGIGFTTNPAAEVKGLYVPNQEELNIEKDSGLAKTTIVKEREIQEEEKINEKKGSLFEEKDVNKENTLTMDTQDLLKQIEGMLSEKIGDSQQFEEAVASVSKVMMEAIKEKDSQWQEEKAEKENALNKATEEQKALASEVAELKEKLESSESRWNELAEEKRLREAKDLFNSRMASITEAFDLDESDLKIVASEVKELDNAEESFASYQEKLDLMWKHKTKAFIEEQEKLFNEKLEAELQKRIEELSTSEASATSEDNSEEEVEESEESVEEVLDEVEEESSASISNNNEAASSEEASLRDKFNQAFSKENIQIKY